MFSRSIALLEKSRRVSLFPTFPSKVARAITTLVKPKYKKLTNSKHAELALALYKRYGNSVIEKAKALQQKKLMMSGKGIKHNAKLPSKVGTIESKGSPKTARPNPHSTKTKRLSSGEKSASQGGMRSLNRNEPSGKSKRFHSSVSAPVVAVGRHSGAVIRPGGADPHARHPSYDAFRASVMKHGNFTPSSALYKQIHRLWRLTSTQTQLSNKAREYMVLRLIKKSHHGSKKGLPIVKKQSKPSSKSKAVQKRAVGTKKNPPKSFRKSKVSGTSRKLKGTNSKSVVKSRSPYIKFYRAMVITGCIPNHPKGVRSRVIKELWNYTNHLKTLSSRIKLGIAFATGAQKFPDTSQVSKIMNKKALSAPILPVSPTKHQDKKAPKAVLLKVPSDYKEDPFIATYKILRKYIPNKTADGRMKAISRAWMHTNVQVGRDRRTPTQRIQAVVNELGL
ncbi:unnamed protein product [Phytomonas sp. Hart1]|nr:unnamed protein product [Phytomonas sp. Hart1]|eukprot:CCW70001.1 unnamed protein product [Phytomonas sp. isolate Hart1]